MGQAQKQHHHNRRWFAEEQGGKPNTKECGVEEPVAAWCSLVHRLNRCCSAAGQDFVSPQGAWMQRRLEES